MRRIRRERTIYLCKACRKMCRRRRIASSYSWSCAYSFSVGWRSQSSCKIGKRSVAMPSRYLRQTSAAGSGEVAKQARNRWGDAALALTPCPSPRLDRVADRLVIRRQNATRVAVVRRGRSSKVHVYELLPSCRRSAVVSRKSFHGALPVAAGALSGPGWRRRSRGLYQRTRRRESLPDTLPRRSRRKGSVRKAK
jgi:hypothetical protein